MTSETICGYIKKELLTKESFGEVFRVEDPETKISYALKNFQGNTTNGIMESTIVETTILASLEHPNIVKPHKLFLENTNVCCLLEFMDNNLYSYIRQEEIGPSSIFDPINIFSQIVCAVGFLHRNNIIHANLCPECILIRYNLVGSGPDYKDLVKVSDLDCLISPENKEVFRPVGIYGYKAPELTTALNDTGFFSNKVDIWSLGCIFYELFTHKPLFPLDNDDKLGKHIEGILYRYRRGLMSQESKLKYFGNFPKQYEPLLFSMLDFEPQYRPNAKTILLELKKLYQKGTLHSSCERGLSYIYIRPIKLHFPGRTGLIDWIVSLIRQLYIAKENFVEENTINLFDKYWMAKKGVSPKKRMLVMSACLLISCKLFTYSLNIDDLIFITENDFTREDLINTESDIVKTLKFKLYVKYTENRTDILKSGSVISVPKFSPQFKNITEFNEEGINQDSIDELVYKHDL